jgi:purine-nucleoside phosphorylase
MARSLARDGVVAVEMEVAALYAVGRYRGVRVASLLVVSDELSGLKWKPGFRHAAFLRARRTALRVLVDAIGRTGR